MKNTSPHIIQYQGSKRILAPQILQYLPQKFNRLIEPFAGMAAITIAVAQNTQVNNYHINDLNAPLITLLQAAIESPMQLVVDYSKVWNEQFVFAEGHIQHFYHVRDSFNAGDQSAANMLYLLARCVKGAVRYSSSGNFNQSPDKRRHGTMPETLSKNVAQVSKLLRGKTTFSCVDYREVFDMALPGDIVYMDPPYQGVSNVRDNRYFSGVPFDEFAKSIQKLNDRGIDYLISYDGECGGKVYGEELPKELGCKKILLNAGLSSQGILLGKKHVTFEALYVSPGLQNNMLTTPVQLSWRVLYEQ